MIATTTPTMTRKQAQEYLKYQADHVLAYLLGNGIPITRKNYLDVGWIDSDWREPLDAEAESELPEPLQLL
jgi:hypothetical protein